MKNSHQTYWFSNWIAFQAIVRREMRRFFRFWLQTLIPPAVNTAIYFIIFGVFFGQQIHEMPGQLPYNQFIVPGLIMMAVIYNVYLNVAISLHTANNYRYIEEIIVSPIYSITILSGFIIGGLIRGVLVATIVGVTALCFVHLRIIHPILMVIIILIISLLFSVAGFINGIYAKKYESINLILTFLLTPLTFLGGVFYSVEQIPARWKLIIYMNPITYIVDAFRYSFYNISDFPIRLTISVNGLVLIISFLIALLILKRKLIRV